ncbi:hypothetical protein SLEP1_g26360 [Rubroshorea leprosula]|uniref:Uncharacterized protein n=1 Tax=Rubroshorea leprosula TaxID=152421 RepID=A0AAV5JZ80_9ROSI|nr:hypothetical protein SLEP1_g26360 [Rubroshorea leprosula]
MDSKGLKEGKLDKGQLLFSFLFFFFLSSPAISHFCSSRPPCIRPKPPATATHFRLKNRIFRSALLLLLTAGCSCFVGANCSDFSVRFAAGKFGFPIVLSVITEIEFSVLCE